MPDMTWCVSSECYYWGRKAPGFLGVARIPWDPGTEGWRGECGAVFGSPEIRKLIPRTRNP